LAGQPVAAKVARRSLKGEDGLSPTAQKCRLIGPLRAFRGCGIWSKDSRARG
jgi:hypothetical protein